jgi:hypothetical protein
MGREGVREQDRIGRGREERRKRVRFT